MKTKNLILSLGLAVLTMSFTGQPASEYKIDTQKSKLIWIGKKVVGEHTGSITISKGKLSTDGIKLIGGKFEIDMNSITNTDLSDEGYRAKLVEHLKSNDFFASSKFPKSVFEITKLTSQGKNQYTVSGMLTIKGITKEIIFPAIVIQTEHSIKAQAKVKVDRTKYDIRYGSGSFFDNLGDKAIDNEFEMNIELYATK